MNVRYYVKAKKSWSELHKAIVRDAVNFGIKELGLSNCGSLVVKLRGKTPDYGDAIHLWDDKYLIRISAGMTQKDLICTIFHELTHVKQYAYEELDLSFTSAIWRGKTLSVGEYYNQPWEREARDMERFLYKKYTKPLKSS